MIINHIGISGGKDSTALLLWALHESGYDPATLRVTFCDTGNELPLTYEYIRMLSECVHPIQWLVPDLDFYALARKKGRFPSARARFCTQELKMEPTRRYLYQLIEAGHEILLHTGVRAEESPNRARLPERAWDEWYALPVYRPLLRWKLAQIWEIHARYGIPPNPLYALGMHRVGCGPCIMSRKAEIHRLARLFPERIAMIRAEEQSAAERGRVSTFFAADKIPGAQRSGRASSKDGTLYRLAMIDDVVRWSATSRGGVQYELDFEEEEAGACWHHSGLCE